MGPARLYLLAVKENQGNLYDDIALFFDLAQKNEFAKVTHTYHQTVNGGHGRIEKRQCWGIENILHRVLDVAFREDDSRVRQGNAPQNLAVLRHMALNLLKQEKTAKGGIKAKRLKAAWDDDYLLKVLSR